jgi:hypothetical protein
MQATHLPFGIICASGDEECTAHVFRADENLARHADMLGQLASLGFEELQLHQVGRNQEAFIEAFGARVIPRIN